MHPQSTRMMFLLLFTVIIVIGPLAWIFWRNRGKTFRQFMDPQPSRDNAYVRWCSSHPRTVWAVLGAITLYDILNWISHFSR